MFYAGTIAKSFSVNLCDLYASVVYLPQRNGVHRVTQKARKLFSVDLCDL